MFSGSATRLRNEGDTFPGNDLNNPNFQHRIGAVGMDLPWLLKASGIYEAPYGIMVAGNLQSYAGSPESTTVQVSSNTVPLTQVNQSVQVEPRGETRTPSLTLVDMSFRKVFRREHRTIEPVFEVHNLMNVATVQSRNSTLGPAYGLAANISRGRMLKLGLSMKF